MALVASFDAFTLVIAVVVAGLVALHPRRREVLRLRRPGGAAAVGLTAAAVVLTAYALDQAALQRTAQDGHAALDHYTGMAAAALGILFVLVVAAAGARRERTPGWCAGIGLIVLGAASVAFPDQVSSLGGLWGAVTVAAGAALLAVGSDRAVGARLSARSSPGPS